MSSPFGGSGSIPPICQFHELISPVAIAASSVGGLGPLFKVRDAHWWLGGSHDTKPLRQVTLNCTLKIMMAFYLKSHHML